MMFGRLHLIFHSPSLQIKFKKVLITLTPQQSIFEMYKRQEWEGITKYEELKS